MEEEEQLRRRLKYQGDVLINMKREQQLSNKSEGQEICNILDVDDTSLIDNLIKKLTTSLVPKISSIIDNRLTGKTD